MAAADPPLRGTMIKTNRLGTAAVAAIGALLLAGCGGTSSVSRSEVEKQVSQQLTAQVGRKPDKISCPGSLKAKVGTTMRCTLTDSGKSYGVTVKVTSVDGSNVKFHIQVDNKPKN
ncbi:hypothetical protein Athai_42080 [Actinocatenispora thailandica]|uniref:DUF4333 domain-containing protein n=1 Tax=Actinocatenispora thailandica TaxID=227318 RepID=A0A7R7DRR7_9ACTN|nr:DUF4333 domain-containing protein [Actinocatenispora thailandica]BCJ36705.1 hypothetical protein Athai_42080 [Actinocatenispora thailandica]